MKNSTVKVFTVLLLLGLLFFTQTQISLGLPAGQFNAYSLEGAPFNLCYVPGAASFPTGTDDAGTCTTVNYGFWMGDTEVTYRLWSAVCSWATDSDRGANVYLFQNPGVIGDGTGDTFQHPVTTINWRSAMVWCNALTEYYNFQFGTDYECVYTYGGAVIRDSRNSNATACDNAVASSTAKGFRLPTSMEWELAARYKNGTTWNPGNYASGATANYLDAAATGAVGWYLSNSEDSVQPVGQKNSNALGIHDLSGNVFEWCFDANGGSRVVRSSDFDYPENFMQIGFVNLYPPTDAFADLGFRFVRTDSTPGLNLRKVPGAASFPTGVSDSGTCTTVNYTYWLADTEITYQLWMIVYNWATDPARGSNRYYFQNPGEMGYGGTTDQNPVTRVGWRDAMVWCNALTEYYNSQNGTNYGCVYTYTGAIVRDSRDTYAFACNNVTTVSGAKGFRLPTSMEWELAARYKNGSTWTPGNYASGATANYLDGAATGAVAWYQSNSGIATHPVATRTANSLGLYDMSGNVGEWCFDVYSFPNRVFRGGAYSSTSSSVRLGTIWSGLSAQAYIGFRVIGTDPNPKLGFAYVPGATGFPTGISDSATCTTVNYSYWMANTEVTYQTWAEVYNWATDTKRGSNRYFFQNPGSMGFGYGTLNTNQSPVNEIGWRDAMVWCNALTEFYNARYGIYLAPAYRYASAIVRDSRNSNATACDNVTILSGAKGFRLPTSTEWELAARYKGSDSSYGAIYRNGLYWTPGSYASGATANSTNVAATGAVAWYGPTSSNSTHPVASLTPNALGIYDMSGNLGEWCFDLYDSTNRVFCGGAYSSDLASIRLATVWAGLDGQGYIGFRLARIGVTPL